MKEAPFFTELHDCALKYKSISGLNSSCGRIQCEDLKLQATMGLYEGETSLYFMIAQGDSATVEWLLDHDARSDQKFVGLFLRPRYRTWVSLKSKDELKNIWQSYPKYSPNIFAASDSTYFGLIPLHFAAGQVKDNEEGVRILDLLINKSVASLRLSRDTMQDKDDLEKLDHIIWVKQHERIAKRAVVNQRDEYGNTALHLAAWNMSQKAFSSLLQNRADPNIMNNDGLTPLTLTARHGLWNMFSFIYETCNIKTTWTYGRVTCRLFDYSHIDSTRNLNTKLFNNKFIEILCKILYELDSRLINAQRTANWAVQAESNGEEVEQRPKTMDSERKKLLKSFQLRQKELLLENELTGIKRENRAEASIAKSGTKESDQVRFVCAVEVVRLFKPKNWHEALQLYFIKGQLKKWDKLYSLVYWGQNVIPYLSLYLLFGLMWWRREIVIVNEEDWGEIEHTQIVLSLEASCGWASLLNSHSGRLQATLILYGIPSLLRLAWIQRRLRMRDLNLDSAGFFSSPVGNLRDFLYKNLESLLCTIVAFLFLVLTLSRIQAQAGSICLSSYLDMEKNTTSISAILLFSTLLLLMKPSKVLGQFSMIMYDIIVRDIGMFISLYLSLYVAFVLGIYTLDRTHGNFFAAVEQSSLPASDKLGCRVRELSDVTYDLFTLSFGDNLKDVLSEGRKECEGLQPDSLHNILLVVWIILTNLLQLNMIIAMMSHTYDQRLKQNDENWKVEIFARIIRYEKLFPELWSIAHKPHKAVRISSHEYWVELLRKTVLVLYCTPELHFCTRLCVLLVNSSSRRHLHNQVGKVLSALEDEFKFQITDWIPKAKFLASLKHPFKIGLLMGPDSPEILDSQRLLHFAINQKLKELPASDRYIQDLLQDKACVKDILEQNSLDGLTALCDMLTIMILAMEKNQRVSQKPSVTASHQDIEHKGKQQHIGAGKDQDYEHKDKTASVSHDDIMGIDPTDLYILEKEFAAQRYIATLPGNP
mmetsp:Transcript_60930/g.127721  ORF Transcript_60930/g.127721 Transcript_60930/m.127721 type:complete len:990 (-) Transcript_60930:733-3702(-)